MANQAWLYFLQTSELLSHKVWLRERKTTFKKSDYPLLMAGVSEEELVVEERRVTPASRRGSGQKLPLLVWIESELESGSDKAGEGEALVGAYLIEHEPGMSLAGDFRHEWAFDEDLGTLARDFPETRQRVQLANMVTRNPEAYMEAQEAFLSALDLPLLALKLRGWLFLLPQDIEALARAYVNPSRPELHHEGEWQAVFELHRAQRYDLAALIYTSLACV